MKCQCGEIVAKRTARGGESAGKQYFCCDKPQDTKCAFFAWASGNQTRVRTGNKRPRVQFCQPPFQRLFFQVTASVLPPAVLSIPGVRQTVPETYTFPMKSYERVMHMLGDDCDGIPSWAHRMVLSKPDLGMIADEIKTAMDSLPEQILPYQREGIAYALQCGGRCLFGDEMGLGKSLQALFTLSFFPDEWPMLIVCPSSLRLAWRDQALQWLGMDAADIQVVFSGKDSYRTDAKILVISYDLLRRNEAKFAHRAVDGSSFLAVIIDECHFIKDFKSLRTKVVQQVCKSARRCLLLSGTPAVNRAIELYTQLVALIPALMPSLTQYAERYCEKEIQTFGHRQVEKWVGAKRQDELHIILTSTCMIRRKKSDVLTQLPPKRRMKVSLDPQKMDASKLKLVIAKVNEFENFDPNEPPPQVSELFRQTAEAKMDATLDYVEYLIESTGNEQKMLIFGHHHCTLDGLCAALEGKVGYISIDGRTAQTKRADYVKQFQEDPCCRVAVLSITACGTGLTLTAASLVIFAELYWVPGQLQQAEDRAHRIGQESMVTVQYLIAEHTLDERIFDSVNKKALDTSGILDGKHGKRGMRVESSVGVNTPLRGARAGKRNIGTPKKGNLERFAFDHSTIVVDSIEDTALGVGENPEVDESTKDEKRNDTSRALEEIIGDPEHAEPSAHLPAAPASVSHCVFGGTPSRKRQLTEYQSDPGPSASVSSRKGLQKHRSDGYVPPITPKKRGRPKGPSSRRAAASKKSAAAAVTAATLAATLCASPSSSSSIAVPPDVALRAHEAFAFPPNICPNLGDLFCRFLTRLQKTADTTAPVEKDVRIGRWFSCQYQILVMSLRFNGLLSPNVLAERAARRYMMEFCGKNKKSVLRALLEDGRFPVAGAFLEIVRIHHTPAGNVVELTDGWYIVPCEVSTYLLPFLLEGARVRVLELTRLSGHFVSPLDLTSGVPALRMHLNATSVTERPNSTGKLGRCRERHPGSLRCADIHPDGGLISRMDVTCVRALPSPQRSNIENEMCERTMLCVDTFDECPAEAEFFMVTYFFCSPIASGARVNLSHVHPSRCPNGVLYIHAPTISCIHLLSPAKPPAIETWQPPLFPSDKAMSRTTSGVALQFTQRARAGNIVDLRGILLHVEPLHPNSASSEITNKNAHTVDMSAFYVLCTPASLICYVIAPQCSVAMFWGGDKPSLGHEIAWDVVCFKHHDARPMGVFFDVFHFVALGNSPQCGAPQFALCDEWRAHLALLVPNARLPRDCELTPRSTTRKCEDYGPSARQPMQTPTGISQQNLAVHPTVSTNAQSGVNNTSAGDTFSGSRAAVAHPTGGGPQHTSDGVDLPMNTKEFASNASSNSGFSPRAAGALKIPATLHHATPCKEKSKGGFVLKAMSNGPLASDTTSAFPVLGFPPARPACGSASALQAHGFKPVTPVHGPASALPAHGFAPATPSCASTSPFPLHGFTPITSACGSPSALPARGFTPIIPARGSTSTLAVQSCGSAPIASVCSFAPVTPNRDLVSPIPARGFTSTVLSGGSAPTASAPHFAPVTPMRDLIPTTLACSSTPVAPAPHSTMALPARLGATSGGQALHGASSPRFSPTPARPTITPIGGAPASSALTFGTLVPATSLGPAPSSAQNAAVYCSRPPTPVPQHSNSSVLIPSLHHDGNGGTSSCKFPKHNVAGSTMNNRSSGADCVPNYTVPLPNSCMNEQIRGAHTLGVRKRVIDCTESPIHTAKKSCF